MKIIKTGTAVLAVALSLLLTACGGGGGGSNSTSTANASSAAPTTATLADAGNNHENAKRVFAAANYLNQTGFNVYTYLFSDVLPKALSGPTQNCTNGGTYAMTFSDADGSSTVTPGDTASVTFAACQTSLPDGEQVTLNGAALIQVGQPSATAPVGTTDTQANITLSQFSVTQNGVPAVYNGSALVDSSSTGGATVVGVTGKNLSAVLTSPTGAVTTMTATSLKDNSVVVLAGTPQYLWNTDFQVTFADGLKFSVNATAVADSQKNYLIETNGALTSGTVQLTNGSEQATEVFSGANSVNITGAATVQTSQSEMTATLNK